MTAAGTNLMWVKRASGWCQLLQLELALMKTYGVYVIWQGGFPSRTVRVGHGDIARELQACREDARVLDYLKDGPLLVTWAAADAFVAPGIRRYLEDELRPLIEDRVAARVVAIPARSPF